MSKGSAPSQEFLGIGLYAVSDAARLLQTPAVNIRRWLGGYWYSRAGERHEVPPLWTPDVPKLDENLVLSFRDLIELRFVSAFLRAGLGLKTIRHCLDYAREVVDNDRPFSTSRFRTDGRTIFLESIEHGAEDDGKLLDLRQHQYAFVKVLERSFKDLDIEGEEVARWRPYKGKDTVVIDPQRSFGQPIAAQYGVPTIALAEAVVAEGSQERVALLYEMSIEAVKDAVRFEQELRAA
jgi:uncharacterized protein (DUF433 family)